MKNFLLYLLAGFIGGIPGGMGMGGGTLLVPLLSFFKEIDQHVVQSVNLVAFIPMASVALYMHAKNKLIEKKGLLSLIIPAVGLAVIGGLIAKSIQGEVLRKIFGGFMIILSVFIAFIEKKLTERKTKNDNSENLENKL